MQRQLIAAAVGTMLLASSYQGASAWDGKRKGFLLGYGAGIGWADYERNRHGTQRGVNTNLKIGWGVNDKTLIYYSGHSFLTTEGGGGGVTLLVQPTATVSYYFSSDSPAPYATAGIGFGGDINVDGFRPGFHAIVGLGYEAFRHWSLEFNVNTYFTESLDNNFEEGWLMSYLLSVNVLGF